MSDLTTWVTYSVLLIDAAVRLVVVVAVIYKRRPVAVTLAWLLLLAFLPVLSWMVYVLVGEVNLGSRRAKRYAEVSKRLMQLGAPLVQHSQLPDTRTHEWFHHVASFGTAVAGIPPMRGNRVALLPDNDGMLESLIADIDAARHHAHLMFYIWSLDAGAQRVADAMIRAARRGVQCRVLVDGVGSWSFVDSPMWKQMSSAGVQVVEALPVNMLRRPLARIDLRNHRKIAAFDGRTAYCGSQNIHDTTFRATRWRNTGQWIDASVRVEGPAAQVLGLIFLLDWQLDSHEDLSQRLHEFLPDLTVLSPHQHAQSQDALARDSLIQAIPSGPGPTPQAIHQAFLTLIYSAREELVMATPYFVPDEATLAALAAAASRGVRVTLIMPKVSDSFLVAAASRSHYLDLLEAGVRIHHYTRGLLHAKTLSIDGKVGLIGSANFDARSFFLNFEITLLIYDQDFAHRLGELHASYLCDAYEVTLDAWRKRKWWEIIRDNSAQLLGPLL